LFMDNNIKNIRLRRSPKPQLPQTRKIEKEKKKISSNLLQSKFAKRRFALFVNKHKKLSFLKKKSLFFSKNRTKFFSSKHKKTPSRLFLKSRNLLNKHQSNYPNWFNLKIRKLSKNSTPRDKGALSFLFNRTKLKGKPFSPSVGLANFIIFFFTAISKADLLYLYKFFFHSQVLTLKRFTSFKDFFKPFILPINRRLVLSSQSPFRSASQLLFFYFNNLFLLRNWINFFSSLTVCFSKNRVTARFLFYTSLIKSTWRTPNHPLVQIANRGRFSEELNSHTRAPAPFFVQKSVYSFLLFKNVKHLQAKKLRFPRKIKSMFAKYRIFGTFYLFINDLNFSNLVRTKTNSFFVKPSDAVNRRLIVLNRYSEQLGPAFTTLPNRFAVKNSNVLFPNKNHLNNLFSQVSMNRRYAENDNWIESNFFFARLKKNRDRGIKRFLPKALLSCFKPSRYKNVKSLLFLPNVYNFSDKNFILNKISNRPKSEKRFSRLFSSFKKDFNKKTLASSNRHKNLINYFFSLSKPEFLLVLTASPLFFRYFFYKNDIFRKNSFFNFSNFFLEKINAGAYKSFFYSNFLERNLVNTNIIPNYNFKFFLKKYLIKTFSCTKFPSATAVWHYLTIIKFLEFCSGKKVYINFFTFLTKLLSPLENARCELWSQRLRSFKRVFGAKLFVTESLQIIYTALKLKDPYFLSNWLLGMFYKVSFWKLKIVVRYLQHVLRYFFQPHFKEIAVKGLKVQIKGKVSVAGNARTRTVRSKVGRTSHATYNNKVLCNLNLIRTFTGVIGFKTWLVF